MMRSISLQMQTLYADLLQSLEGGEVLAGTISRRKIKGEIHIYANEKNGAERAQRYLGPEKEPATQQEIERVRRAAGMARNRRTSVTALKAARIPAPSLGLGRILEVLSNAGLFDRGAVLIGTAAYQLYPCVVGAYLSASALMTQDADIGLTELALKANSASGDLHRILGRADPTFMPRFHASSRLPLGFETADEFRVELLTTMRRTSAPMELAGLGCAAQPLPFLDFLLEQSIVVAALYNSGILVRVPDPARYAVHKLIVAHERGAGAAKRQKDLAQAAELLEAFELARNANAVRRALDGARRRGPKWRKAIAAGLEALQH